MHLKADILGIESGGKPTVFLNKSDAEEIGISASGRITISFKKKTLTVIVNITTASVNRGFIGISEEVKQLLGLKQNHVLDIAIAAFPKSLQFIHNKLTRRRLLYDEIYEIVKDVVQGNLNESEISAFVTALSMQGLDMDEATSLALAMVETGEQLDLGKKTIVDKHSIGGVPGDKTTLLVVPIIASMGLTIPKVSSRAITSAGGTADRAEALMPVDLKIPEMEQVVRKSNGCIAWGGSLDIAPADDIFVRSEYSLYIDPMLLPSIMSKKKAVKASHLVIDIPTGRGSKMQTISESDFLAKELIELGRRLGIHTQCVLTNGEKPVGFTLGPSLEAREALAVLMNKAVVPDLVDKVCHIAGSIFEMVGKKNGYQLAREVLRSGKAEQKMREIINLQGGDSKIKIDDLTIGEEKAVVRAKRSGQISWMDNMILIELARAAGAPKDKGAGIIFSKKVGDKVRVGDVLYTIYSEKSRKMSRAIEILSETEPFGIGDNTEMLIHKIKESPLVKRSFIMDR